MAVPIQAPSEPALSRERSGQDAAARESPRGFVGRWPTAIRVVFLLTLVPAMWLGVIVVPAAGAVATIAIVGAYVALLAAGSNRIPALRRADVIVTLDLTIITAVLFVSGNLNSPFLYLYYLAILEAAVALDLRQTIAAAVATACLMLFLWTASGHAATFATADFRIGAFMAGGFLLALVLGMVAQENRASAQQARWNLELDQRLRAATRELEIRIDELEMHNAVARQLSGELRVDGVMEVLLRAFCRLVGTGRGIGSVAAEAGGMRVSISQGPLPSDASGTLPLPAFPEAAQSGEVHIAPYGPPDHPAGWWCFTPLVRSGETRGWLASLGDTRPEPSETVRRRILGLATQSVAALEAARLHEEVQRMTDSDPLRALPPWSTFEQLARDEVERAGSLTLVFSVAEIQWEDYAATRADAQDRDLALRRAVRLLQAPLRRVDVLSYDGAGRFGLLLPRVPKLRALELLTQVVSRLERDDVATGVLAVERLTLSAGVVSFPEDGTTPSALLAGVESLLSRGPAVPARVEVLAS